MLTKAPDGNGHRAARRTHRCALASGDIERALALFQSDCYWRDLVTFTWNIKTMEGKDNIRDMLKRAACRHQAIGMAHCRRRNREKRGRRRHRELDPVRDRRRARLRPLCA